MNKIPEWFWTIIFALIFFGLSLGGGFYIGSHVSTYGFIISTLILIIIFMAVAKSDSGGGLPAVGISFTMCFFLSSLVAFAIYKWGLLLR